MDEDKKLLKEFEDTVSAIKSDPLTIGVKIAYQWFVGFMGESKWRERREEVISYFNSVKKRIPIARREDEDNYYNRMAFYEDWIAWYLYLAEVLGEKVEQDEPLQSSRIMHFFSEIGHHKAQLESVKGVEDKLSELLLGKVNQPDSLLFEFVVAISYIRNGWQVEFIPEVSDQKTPDMRVVRGHDERFVECKRLSAVTGYSEVERECWLKIWKPFSRCLARSHRSILASVYFKEEVCDFDENVLRDIFRPVMGRGVFEDFFSYEDAKIKVSFRPIDMERVKSHFSKFLVRYPSPQLYALCDQDYEVGGSYTILGAFKVVEVGDYEAIINTFVEDAERIFCAKWSCTAERSIDKKAKDVKKLLSKAVSQCPDQGITNIHIGYETVEGAEVEFVRDNKIVNLIKEFDFEGKSVGSVFCHSFQAYLHPGDWWEFAETTRCHYVSKSKKEDIEEKNLFSQPEAVQADSTHWEQDLLGG